TAASYALNWVNPLPHPTNSVKYMLSPMNKNVGFDYDANFRKIDQVAALGTGDEAWTLFEYDAVGNLTKTTDPRGNVSTFGYDDRNRRTSMTDALNHTTAIAYDASNNKLSVTHPDGSVNQYPDYDSMNRLTR